MAELERQQVHIFSRAMMRWKEHTARARRFKELQAAMDTAFICRSLTGWRHAAKVGGRAVRERYIGHFLLTGFNVLHCLNSPTLSLCIHSPSKP